MENFNDLPIHHSIFTTESDPNMISTLNSSSHQMLLTLQQNSDNTANSSSSSATPPTEPGFTGRRRDGC